MNWLLSIGDTDILRDAVSPTAVFWYRLRRGWRWLVAAGVLTVLMLFFVVLLALGPERSFSWGATRLDRHRRVRTGGRVGWGARVAAVQVHADAQRPHRSRPAAIRHAGDRPAGGPGQRPLRRRAARQDGRISEAAWRPASRATKKFDPKRMPACARLPDAPATTANSSVSSSAARSWKTATWPRCGRARAKTIVCYTANYMKVLEGLKVHMVTVNDYLVKRDAEFCRPIFELLSMTVGYISSDMETYGPEAEVRRQAYGSVTSPTAPTASSASTTCATT